MKISPIRSAVQDHTGRFFVRHRITEYQWPLGPVRDKMPDFRVWGIEPGEQSQFWTYVSIGASEIESEERLEFAIVTGKEDVRNVQLVTIAAWYHRQKTLGLGHTFPLGEPWHPGSSCDHFLVARPYPFGSEFELCPFEDLFVRFAWLLPITESERNYRESKGLEALEATFDEGEFDYWDARRPAMV